MGARATRFVKQQAARSCHSERKDVMSASYLIWDSNMWVPDRAGVGHKRMTAKSIAAISAESIPFLGVAVLIADTGYELYAACETLRDLDQLYLELGMADEMPDNVMHSVCDPDPPDAGEVWDGVLGSLGSG